MLYMLSKGATGDQRDSGLICSLDRAAGTTAATVNMRYFALAAALATSVQGQQGWSCNGPVVGQHGSSQGSLSAGAFLVQDMSALEFIEDDITYSADASATVTLQLQGLGSLSAQETFIGFLFIAFNPDNGQLFSASTNGEAYPACAPAVLSSAETPQTSARVDWVLPAADGKYDITIYALADDTTWYVSTFSYRVGGGGDDDDGAVRVSAFAAAAVAVTASLVLW